MKCIHVLRKSCSEPTVAANVLRHGVGVLNIDGCRVAASPADFAKLAAGVEAIRARGGVMENSWKNSSDLSGANPASLLGRWPANLILQHLEGCHIVGTTTVRGDRRTPDYSPRQSGMFNVGQVKSDGRPRGTLHGDQSVLAYECAPGCPVAALDAQSGQSTTPTKLTRGAGGQHGAYSPIAAQGEIPSYGDTGGASRYFKQFVGKVTGEE